MFSIKHSIAEDYKYICVDEVISQYSTYLCSVQIMQERRKIFGSAKYSIKRKHASMIYTSGDFYSFTRNFDLGIRLSEVYCNCKNNILKSVGKRKKFQTFSFLSVSGQTHTNSVKQSPSGGNFKITLYGCNVYNFNGYNSLLMRSSLLYYYKILSL